MVDFFSIDNTNVVDLWKTVYPNMLNNMGSRKAPLLNMIKTDLSATGNVQAHGVNMGDMGGFSVGKIGTESDSTFDQTNYTLNSAYQIGRIDSKSMQLAKRGDAGAFESLMDRVLRDMKVSWDRNRSVLLFGDGTGALGTIGTGGVTDNGGGDYDLVITAGTFIRANFRKGDLIHVDTSTDEFRVDSVDKSTRTVSVTRKTGSQVPADADVLYIQHTQANGAPQGLVGVLEATSGTKYGISIADGWQAQQKNAGSKRLNIDMLVDQAIEVQDEYGEMPDVIVAGKTQYKELVKLAKDSQLHTVSDVSINKGGRKVVFGAMPHVFIEGVNMPIIYDQHCPYDTVMMLNLDQVVIRATGAGEFEDEGGTVLHHGLLNKTDDYYLLFRQYYEVFINPTAHGVIHTLSTTGIS